MRHSSRRGPAGKTIAPPLNQSQPEKIGQQFVDKFGRFHSDAILKNWSPRALHAMGVRKLEP
jgi:hypothetical protein